MESVALYFCLSVQFLAAAMHFYWGFGGRLGYEAAVPRRPTGERLFEPQWWGAHLVGIGLITACWLLLGAENIAAPLFSLSFTRDVVTFLGIAFIARSIWATSYGGFLKFHRNSLFARFDTWLYSPLLLATGSGLIYIAQRP